MELKILSGIHKGKKLQLPSDGVRPSMGKVKKSLFDICRSYLEDATVLDLFAGSGALGLEALSQGAKSVCFVEQSPLVVSMLQKNIATLESQEYCYIMQQEAFKACQQLQTQQQQFDLIFADPPYGKDGSYVAQLLFYIAPLLRFEGFVFFEQRYEPLQAYEGWHSRARKIGNTLLLQLWKKQ